jgi:uncharacterized membrane protein
LNKRNAVLIIVAVSVVGIVLYNMYFAGNGTPKGSFLFQSDVGGVTVTVLGPEETIRSGVTGQNGELTLKELPDGHYQAIATKAGYNQHYMMSLSIANGRTSTVQVYMTPIPSEQTLHTSTDPNAVIIRQGSSGTIAVTVNSPNDYESAVTLRCNQLPSGVAAAFNPPSFTLAAGGEATSTLTLTTSLTAAKGIHTVNIEIESEHGHAIDVSWIGLLLQVS